MTKLDFHTNLTFAFAAARAFGLDPDRVTASRLDTTDFDEVLTIRFEVALSPADLLRIGHEMARIDGEELASAPATETQGVGGRMVEHVDAPESDDAGLPASVWLDAMDASSIQLQMASDTRTKDGVPQVLLQLAFLDDAQRAKYQGEL